MIRVATVGRASRPSGGWRSAPCRGQNTGGTEKRRVTGADAAATHVLRVHRGPNSRQAASHAASLHLFIAVIATSPPASTAVSARSVARRSGF
jgi:hypothetical protein